MNKLIIFCPIFFVIACNNAGDTSGKNKEATANEPITETSVSTDGNNCSKLIFFMPGAEIEAASYNSKGEKTATQLTKIRSVKNEGGFTVATVDGTDIKEGGKTTNVSYSYKCDGNKIYFDVASMFRTDEKNSDDSFESSLIEYPINLTEGETLPDASGTMRSERNGRKMEINYHYRNRKVEGKEEVTTAAGTWNCFKISNTVEAEMNFPGMDEKTKQMMQATKLKTKTSTITWFAPDAGIIKMELYINGKLQSKNEVTAIKK